MALGGGIIILLQGLLMTLVPLLSDAASDYTIFYGLFVILMGLIAICLSFLIYKTYKLSQSVLLLSVAVITMFFAGGGFLIGSVLTSIGGSISLLSA